MTKCLFQLLLTLAGLAAAVGAEDFRTTSNITSLVGQVTSQTQAGVPHPAKLNDPFVTGDLLTTGFTSRAELTAPDHTVIRVGSNSVFGFDEQARQMILRQGSVLFHTPHGQGGGVIKTSAVTAAVSGSTVSICTTSGGGAKVVPLESPCTITGKGGRRIATITPGQMLALLPGAKPIVVSIDLGAFVRSSGLIQKFQAPLAKEVTQKIEQNVDQQQKHAPEKTQILLVDNVALDPNARPPVETLPNNPLGVSLVPPAQPPPKGPVETIFDPQIVAAFKLSLALSAKQLPSATDNIFPVVNSDLTKSPLAYIQSRIGPPPATGRYSGLPFSDPTLAVFGLTPVLPRPSPSRSERNRCWRMMWSCQPWSACPAPPVNPSTRTLAISPRINQPASSELPPRETLVLTRRKPRTTGLSVLFMPQTPLPLARAGALRRMTRKTQGTNWFSWLLTRPTSSSGRVAR